MENSFAPERQEDNFEQREQEIDVLLSDLAEREGMDVDNILSDIITFAPTDEPDTYRDECLREVAEKLGITPKEMAVYAIKKASNQDLE
jgi:hypothetical protein